MNKFKFKAAVVKSGAMEADTISKNGRISKSLTSRVNLLILILYLSGISVYAQDVIVKTNGDEIQAKVEEIGTTEVKYKRYGAETGPTYVIHKSEVLKIQYANGTEDVFPRQAVPAHLRMSEPAQTNPAESVDMYGETADKKRNYKVGTGRIGIGYGSGSLIGEPHEEMSWTGTETWSGAWHLSLVATLNFSPYIGWDVVNVRMTGGKSFTIYGLTGLVGYTPTLGNTNIKGYTSFKFGWGTGSSDYVTHVKYGTKGVIVKSALGGGFSYDFEIGIYLLKKLAIGYVYTVQNFDDTVTVNAGEKIDRKFSLKFPEFRIAYCW